LQALHFKMAAASSKHLVQGRRHINVGWAASEVPRGRAFSDGAG